MKVMIATLSLLAITSFSFSPAAIAEEQTATKSAKKKGTPQGSGSAQSAPKKPPCSPNPERACY